MPSTTTRRDSVLSNANMSQSWDPEDVLQLCHDGRCVGYAPSQGRKCRMPIRCDNVRRVDSLVAELSEQPPDAEMLLPILRRLAEHGLCVRFHQYQVDEMVEKWSRRVRAAYPAPSRRVEVPRQAISSRSPASLASSGVSTPFRTPASPSLSRRSTATAATSTISLPDHSEVETLQETIAAMQEVLRTTQRRLDLLQYAPPPAIASASPTISRVSTSDISSLNLTRTSTVQSTAMSATQRDSTSPTTTQRHVSSSTSSVGPSGAGPSTSSRIVSPTALVTTHATPTRHCTRTHVRRLSLDEECSICYEGDHLSSCAASDLVWCHSGCGRTVHKSCFDAWRAQCITNNQDLTCSICRAAWTADCECQGCTIRHVRRRTVEGDCAICTDSLAGEEGEEANTSNLVWCKDGCGKSLHKECWNTWKAQCESRGRAATCVSCRAVCTDECEC